jgi:hypothetical protein
MGTKTSIGLCCRFPDPERSLAVATLTVGSPTWSTLLASRPRPLDGWGIEAEIWNGL